MKNTTISTIRNAVPFSMRQCYFGLVFLFALMVIPNGYAQITLINPAAEGGFENGTTFAANGWTAVNPAAGTRSWQIGTGQAGYTGARAAFIGNDATTVGTATAARTVHLYRSVTIPAGAENIQLTFKYKQPVSDYVAPNFYDYIAVYTSATAPTNGNLPTGTPHFGPYPMVDVPNFTTQTATLPNSLAGTTTNLIFTFKADGIAAHGYGAVDDISLTYTIPLCASPGGLGSSAVLANSATISWSPTATPPANGYEYYYSTSNTAPTGATVPSGTVGAGITTANISGLTANSPYYFWVRSNCGGTDGVSSWSSAGTFTTQCDAAALPYTINFNTVTTPAVPQCTVVQNAGTGNNWKTIASPGAYGFTSQVLNYSWNGTNPANSWFITQGVNLTAGTSYRVSYKYGNSSVSTYTEKMKVAYGTSPAAAAMTTILADHNAIIGASAISTHVDFTPAVSGVYYFGFNAYSIADQDQLYLDDIAVTLTPTCEAVTSITASATGSATATVNWSASVSAPASGYEYYYSTTNTAPTGSTVASGSVAAGVTTANITGLTATTTYYVWVRANCGGTDGVSEWSPVASFLTLCEAATAPFLQAFSAGTIPSCWTTTSSNTVANGLWKFTGAVDYDNGNTRPDGTFAWVDGSDPSTINDVTLLSPSINLAGLTVPELVFDYFSNNQNTYPNNIFKVDVFDGTVWTNVYTNNTSDANWRTISISLAAYTGTTIRLRFVVDKTPAPVGFAFYNDILLDNVIVQETPACPSPTGVTASTASLTGGNVTWTAPSSAPANGYEYYYSTTNTAPTASTPASGTVAAGTTNTTITGLTTATTYYVWVRSACTASLSSTWVGPGTFFTGYCTPAPTSSDGTGITNVTLGTINNTTAGETGYYGNYSAMTTNAAVGSTVNFSITFNTCDAFGCYTYGTKIWIDFNDDADFNDAGELVYTGLSGNTTPIVLTGSFNISPTAALGSHRMRIGATDTDSGPANACYTGSYGVFEDYTINIFMPPAPAITGFTPATVCAATGDITITGTDLANATALTIGGTAVTIATNTNTQITAAVPAGVSGVVAVTTVAGTSTTVDTFAVSTPPAITLSGANTTICVGDTTNAVTIATGAAAYDTFTWAPATGVSGTAATGYTFNPTATTTFTLTASNSVSGCVTTADYTVNVNVLPTALVMDDAAGICEGGAAVPVSVQGGITLGTILTENFNAATNSWTTTNNSTGGTPANSAWTLRPDGYEIPGYDEFVFSNDNTQFYLSNSDSQGSGSTTSVILRSPAFSTVGYTSANITFHHFYMQWQTSTAKVEASVNGTNWTTLQTYNTDQGEYGSFEAETVALTPAFLNQPTVYIRFKFDANWGYFWGIDNVAISGQQTGAVTWAPMAGLYTDAAATTAYTGQSATTVYAKPTSTTTYTATATNAAGCTVTDQIVINYSSTPEPTTDNDVQIICNAGTVADLQANGTAIQWYTSPSGGQALAPSTALPEGVTLYYGSQTVDGCESVDRVVVAAVVNVNQAPIAIQSEQMFCAGSGATIGDLSVIGSGIVWYADDTTTTPLADDTVLESGVTYYASQTIDGCESSARVPVTAMFNVTAAPMADAEQFFCNEATVSDLSADGENIQWYADATGGTALTGDTPLVDGVIYHASQTIDDCEGTDRRPVTAYISQITEPMGEETQVVEENVQGTATIADINVTGDNLVWYASEEDALAGEDPLDETELLESGATYWVTQTVGICTSAPLAVTVTVQLGRNNFDAATFKYYPNPVRNVLNISYSADITSVTVYNLLGQQVLSKELNAATGTVDMTALQDGTYLVNVTSGDSVQTIKVIKKQ